MIAPSRTRSLRRALVGLAALLGAPGAARAEQSVPVPSVIIYPGDIIRDGMLSERALPDDYAGRTLAVLDRAALIGKTARRTLLPGQPINANAVGDPKIVTVGAMVKVMFVEGGLVISTYAAALQAGAVGDVIAVRNQESGLVISGTIEKDGSIKVNNG